MVLKRPRVAAYRLWQVAQPGKISVWRLAAAFPFKTKPLKRQDLAHGGRGWVIFNQLSLFASLPLKDGAGAMSEKAGVLISQVIYMSRTADGLVQSSASFAIPFSITR